MPRLTPQPWQILACIFGLFGYTFQRQEGSHMAFKKDGAFRDVIIPRYDSIGVRIIQGLMKTAGITREEYFAALEQCK